MNITSKNPVYAAYGNKWTKPSIVSMFESSKAYVESFVDFRTDIGMLLGLCVTDPNKIRKFIYNSLGDFSSYMSKKQYTEFAPLTFSCMNVVIEMFSVDKNIQNNQKFFHDLEIDLPDNLRFKLMVDMTHGYPGM